MRHHPKSVLAITLSVAASIWWVSIQNYSSSVDERVYSRQECAEDLCKISVDLAQFATNRGDVDGAIHNLLKAIDHKPDDLLPYQRLCQLYQQQTLFEKALQTYFIARHATAACNMHKPTHGSRSLLQNPLPWQGEELTEKKLYIEADGSIEDCICFIRFVLPLTLFKAEILCKVPDALLSLCKSSFPTIQFYGTSSMKEAPSCDYYISLSSLPALLKTSLQTLTIPKGYLQPDNAHTAAKKTLLSPGKLRIGLWLHDAQKNNVPLSLLQDLIMLPQVQFYTLQPLQQTTSAIIDVSKECHTLDDAVALIKNIDYVIAVDSPIAHLTGAVGTPVWLLAKHVPDDWRWSVARKGTTSAWYPSMRIFQQPKAGDWLSVIADVHEALIRLPKTP